MTKVIPKFRGCVVKGKLLLDPHTKDKLDKYVSGLEGAVALVIKQWHEKTQRSIQQNKYYWAVVVDLFSRHSGYSSIEMNEVFKQKFLSEEMIINNQTFRVITKSSKQLNTKQMEEYMEEIRMWAAEDGLNIPLPNEVEDM